MVLRPALGPALISFPLLGNFGEVIVYDLRTANGGYMRLHEAETRRHIQRSVQPVY